MLDGVGDAVATDHLGITTTPIANSAAMSPREREIAAIWAAALGISEVGRHETFFDIGGDSLSALTVTLRMESAGLSPAAITRMLHGESIARIAAAEGEDSRPVASLRARTGDAINMTRGLLVLLIITTHWAPFLIERSGSYASWLMQWSTPLFHAGTPGFALLFGVGLAYWYIPLRRRNPQRLQSQLRSNLRLVTAGVLVIALAILVRDMTTGEPPLHGWAVQLFYGVLLAYCLMLATAGPTIALIDRSRWPIRTALLLSLIFLGIAELCRALFEGSPGNGIMELLRLMLVAKYAFPRMLSYMAAGIVLGLAIGRYNEHPGFAPRAALVGTALFAGDVALSIWLGVTERWFRPIGSNVTLLGYASLTLLLFALFFVLAQRVGRGARLLSIVGILAFPLFIGQALVMPAKDILVAFAMPYALSVALPLGAFVLAAALGIRHFSRLYQGSGSSVP